MRKTLAGFLLVLVAGALGLVAYRQFVPIHNDCDICGRERHEHLEATAYLKDGSIVETCCARCALHMEVEKPGQVTRLIVEDAGTGESLDGRSAVYLVGSEAGGCHPDQPQALREPGIQYELKYDRCVPALLAFRDWESARNYQKDYGGRLLSYQEAVQEVRQR